MGWEYRKGNKDVGGLFDDHEVDVNNNGIFKTIDDHGYEQSVLFKAKTQEYGDGMGAMAPLVGTGGSGSLIKGAIDAEKAAQEAANWYKLTGIDLQLFAEGGEVAIKEAGSANPSTIRFTQDSISGVFKDGRTITDLIDGLKSGEISPDKVTPVRIFEKDGNFFTLDNRRLYAYQQAGVAIPYRWATAEEVANETWKFTTKNDGISIRVRGGN
jgi:hypothetical protein